jgi:hypothetical protein
MPNKKARIKRHVHKRLSNKMKLYFAFSIIMIGIVVYEVITTGVNPFLALII